METSDSDYFESADEDIASDDDDQKNTVVYAPTPLKESLCSVGKNQMESKVNEEQQHVAIKTNTYTSSLETKEFVTKSDSSRIINKKKEMFDNSNNLSTDNLNLSTDLIAGEQIENLLVKEKQKHKDQNKMTKSTRTTTPNEINSLQEKAKKINIKETQHVNNDYQKADDYSKIQESPHSINKNQEFEKIHEKNEVNNDYDMWEHEEIDWNDVDVNNKCQQEKSGEGDDEWENDKWEAIESISCTKPQDKESNNANKSWGDWGNWGVTSLFNTATQGVSTLTSHVSQGLTTVLETGIGIPDPDELAKQHKLEKEKIKEQIKESNHSEDDDNSRNTSLGFGLGNLVSGVSHITKLVEVTSNKVISGGLDTLETIGKKTMEVLQEGDPGLKKKRAYLKIDSDKPVLSQLLREAKQKAEEENKKLEQQHFAKKANYETLFDDHQGLVHLEALEMLSKQCDIKLQSLLETLVGDTLTDMQETMAQVKELCEIVEEDEEAVTFDDIKEKLINSVTEINVPISYDKLITTWTETDQWLYNLNLNVCSEHELHQQAIEILAQLTAISVEQFHKMGELLLIKEHRSTADEADSLVQLTTTLTALIGLVATKFSDKLNAITSISNNKENVNSLITNVFFEAANSSSYIQDAFQLLIPVLQVGAV